MKFNKSVNSFIKQYGNTLIPLTTKDIHDISDDYTTKFTKINLYTAKSDEINEGDAWGGDWKTKVFFNHLPNGLYRTIKIDPNGRKEVCYMAHRSNLPSIDGDHISPYDHFIFHNPNGPAVEIYNGDGEIVLQHYFLRGKEYTDEKLIKHWNSKNISNIIDLSKI